MLFAHRVRAIQRACSHTVSASPVLPANTPGMAGYQFPPEGGRGRLFSVDLLGNTTKWERKIDKEACTYGKHLGYQYRHEIGRDHDRGGVGQKARDERNQEPEISSGPQLATGFAGESR